MVGIPLASNKDNHATIDELAMTNKDNIMQNSDVLEYLMNIKGELNQVDRLISDAVNNLVMNFKYISNLTKSHHDMVLAIEKMTAPEDSKNILTLLDKQMTIADKIEQELEMVITSLQFGDLVTQLLAHTTRQLEALNIELQHVNYANELRCTSENDELQTGISRAVNMAKAKNKKKPVVQQGMQMGEIELF